MKSWSMEKKEAWWLWFFTPHTGSNILGNSVQKKAHVGSSGCRWYFSYFSWTPARVNLKGLKFRTARDAHSVHWLKRDGRSGWHHRGEFKKENPEFHSSHACAVSEHMPEPSVKLWSLVHDQNLWGRGRAAALPATAHSPPMTSLIFDISFLLPFLFP